MRDGPPLNDASRPTPPPAADDAPVPRAPEPGARADRVAETAGAGDDQAAAEPSVGRFVGHAVVVAAFTGFSRVTGLVRDAALAAVFGLSGVADAFFLGFLAPNLFRRLFGEGALTAAFIPVYTRLRAEGGDGGRRARRFAALVLAVLFLGLGVVTMAGEIALGVMLGMEGWSASHRLAIELAMRMAPYMPLVCGVAVLGAILQVRGAFAPAAAAPVLLNLCMIVAALATPWLAPGDPADAARWIGGAVLVAGGAQLLVVGLPARRSLAWPWGGAGETRRGLREPAWRVLAAMGPMVLGLAVVQINTLTDALLATWLAPQEGGPARLDLFGWETDFPIAESGAVAALTFAQRLYQFPLGVFGIAIATAIFPALAAHAAAAGSGGRFAETLRRGVRLSLFIALPAAAGLLLVRLPLTRLAFQYQAFDVEDAERVARLLLGYASGVWAYALVHLLTRASYALEDVKTPLRISLLVVVVNFGLNLTLVWWFGALAMAASTAICAVLQVALLASALGRRGVAAFDGETRGAIARLVAITGVMAAGVAGAVWAVERVAPLEAWSRPASAGVLAGLVVLGAGIYLGGARLTRSAELGWLVDAVRRRGGRGEAAVGDDQAGSVGR